MVTAYHIISYHDHLQLLCCCYSYIHPSLVAVSALSRPFPLPVSSRKEERLQPVRPRKFQGKGVKNSTRGAKKNHKRPRIEMENKRDGDGEWVSQQLLGYARKEKPPIDLHLAKD